MTARLTRFKCWWCQRTIGVRYLHHKIHAKGRIRRCCERCNGDPESNFNKVYPGGVEQELSEVARVQEWRC